VNLPNRITVARLVLALVLFVFLEAVCRGRDGAVWYVAFALYLVTVLSDGIDGYLARSRGEVTAFGRIADPFADKIVICGVLVLAQNIPETADLVPSWVVLLVLGREFLVSGLRGYLEGQGMRFGSLWEGKTKLIVQAAYCGAVVVHPGHRFPLMEVAARVCLYGTAAISVYSAFAYIRRAAALLRKGADV
jgi:CDP-diacylglycerol--glycerol-3-phosphate 3-phosphatidyltransferase